MITPRQAIQGYLCDEIEGNPRRWNGTEMSTDQFIEYLAFEGFEVVRKAEEWRTGEI